MRIVFVIAFFTTLIAFFPGNLMNAEIITIGTEILIGQVVDTNSAFLATELNKLGILVVQITTISDDPDEITCALNQAGRRAKLVFTTGGLGPTNDDVTKQTLADYFGSPLVVNETVLEHIRSLLASRGVAMNERNYRQAELPVNCELLPNSAGSAPGMWFFRDEVNYICLPGVPFEMKAIFSEEIKPRLINRFMLPAIHHITVLTHGIPESEMAMVLEDWERKLPVNIKLAFLPSPGMLRLRLTGRSDNTPEELKVIMEEELKKLEKIIGPHIFGYGEDRLEEITGRLLREHGLSLSVAESCTGGMLGATITAVPGSSDYFKGGIVAYSNEIKTIELNVSPYTLMINGSVSQAVAEQMAEGVRSRFNTDYSIAVTGIAGPTGGSVEKPVGTTWIAVASRKRIISHVHQFGEHRGRNVQKAVIASLFMLRDEILGSL
jgi:nicotinamide-nucleotide amidase